MASGKADCKGWGVKGDGEEAAEASLAALACAFCCCFRSMRARRAAFFKADLDGLAGSSALLNET